MSFNRFSTSQPGITVCEHLPLLSRHMHQLAQVRSVHHTVVDHNAGTYYALTGRSPVKGDGLIVKDEPGNFPPVGSVLAKLQPLRTLPPFVHLPELMFNNSADLPGQRAGVLGAAYQPFVIGDPSAPGYEVPGLTLHEHVSHERLNRRVNLLQQQNEWANLDPQSSDLSPFQQQAIDFARFFRYSPRV